YNIVDNYLQYKIVLDYYANESNKKHEPYCNNIIKSNLNNNPGYMKPCLALLKHSYTLQDNDYASYINITFDHLNMWLKEQIKGIPNYIYDVSAFYNILKSHNLSKPFISDLCDGQINDIHDSIYIDFQFLNNLYDKLNIYRNIFDYDDLKLKKFKELYNIEIQKEKKCPNTEKVLLSYPEQEHTEEQKERRYIRSALQTIPEPREEDQREVGFSESNSFHYSIIIPVSIILLFTPLGSFLSLWISEKKKQWYNNYKHDDHLLHDSENEERDLQNTRYNIQYYSA
ncbi:PIR Superfamily Protein, partial [Plasmodium ovale curtisi]